ncbi:MAG: glycosyl transferase [Isosphaeraceae bacterium]|jgi:glycosyltransferase involved in cell wall biosynthesis|nr:MAG: glycosyl transferase [Isosphaeraceae bacterium]
MAEPRISALIIARDAAHDLPGCLDSLTWTDERIVVVDPASSDATEALARRLADQTVVRPFDTFAAQRNAGLARAQGRWVLAVDADERVTPELAQEIQTTIAQSPPEIAGYRIPIRSILFGRPFVASGTQLDRPLRLFLRDRGRWVGRVHETVELNGAVGQLRHVIDHRTHETLSVFLSKLDRYTTLEAAELASRGRRPRPFDLTLRPLGTFFRLYLARAGFRDGVEGFLFCSLSAVSTLVRYAKLRELDRTRPAPAKTLSLWAGVRS